MNLLFTLNQNYVPVLNTLLISLIDHHETGDLNIFILHSDIDEESIDDLTHLMEDQGHQLKAYQVSDFLNRLSEAKVNRYYTMDMYTWLFAPFIIEEKLDRGLYIDPDVINLNSIEELYHMDLEGNLFAAADYEFKNWTAQPINNLRLGNYKSSHFYNTGIVLMDFEAIKKEVRPEDIMKTIKDKEKVLYLPDQDVFNYMFESKTKKVDWRIYNLDPRAYELLAISESYDQEWVEEEVVFIHYCGKHKPFNEGINYRYRLGKYYFEYEKIRDLLAEADQKKKLSTF